MSPGSGVTAVAIVVGAAVVVVAVVAALAPDPQAVERPPLDAPVAVPAVPEREPPAPGTFAEGRLPSGTWSAAARPGPDGICIEVDLTTDRSGEGVGTCGLVRGIELAQVGPTPDGWLVVAGMVNPDVARVVLEGEDVPEQETELSHVEGVEERAFAVAINRDEGYFEVVAYDVDGEVIERSGLAWR